MKKNKISNTLHSLVVNFCNNLFSDRRISGKNSFKKPVDNLKELLSGYPTSSAEHKYIEKIINEYHEILYLKPSSFGSKILEFERILIIDDSSKNEETYKFSKKIIEALRYDAYRDKDYPRLIDFLGWNVKVCFYCNYAGTLNLSQNKSIKTYYDLDHVLPKSKYPFLATTFYNFVPACATCNRNKSNLIITGLNPFYEKDTDYSNSEIFILDKKSYSDFLLDGDAEKIKIKIADYINLVPQNDYNKIVDLENLYSSQNFIIQELIWKKRIYDDIYINQLLNFKGLNLSKGEINRILWGNDLDDNNINDRPLAKLTQDILTQL